MSNSNKNTKTKNDFEKIRDLCLDNASDLVKGAKKMRVSKLHHIQHHLAVLALEEIGKAELLGMELAAGINKRQSPIGSNIYENHVKKLFWALWGPSFAKNVITREQIDEFRGLATSLHANRLISLYVDPDDNTSPKTKISQKEADNVTSLAEARIGMEKNKNFIDPNDPNINKEEIGWFIEASEDAEKRALIFGRKSQEKLIKFGNVRNWISWLKKQFDENDIKIRKIVEEELHREKPKGKEAKKPKYKIRIRINSESHSIRNKELKKWNENIDFIKLNSDDKRDLICDFYLPKATHIKATWFIGWGMARAFVTALNIATKGFFWWHVPKDRSRFYEDMWDLERNMKMGVEQRPELTVNFKDLRWVLKDSDLGRASMLFYYITKVKGKEEGVPFNDYVLGLSFLAKNDIHLRFELNAFAQFFQALKNAFRISGDWDGKSDFIKAVHKQFIKLGDFTNLDEYLQWGEEQEQSADKKTSKEITLTEVFGMKLYTDIYLEKLAKKSVESLKKEKPTKDKN
ncbi:AbiV family abortive infection protein [Patescibacteria group bacterium]